MWSYIDSNTDKRAAWRLQTFTNIMPTKMEGTGNRSFGVHCARYRAYHSTYIDGTLDDKNNTIAHLHTRGTLLQRRSSAMVHNYH
jgi:hypothetical protein